MMNEGTVEGLEFSVERTGSVRPDTSHSSFRKSLGQYFTPEHVVELCFLMIRDLDPDARQPRIIDPACGEGAFLAYALKHDITTPDRLFGIEKDPQVAARWAESGLGPPVELRIGDGLVPTALDLSAEGFDWVVGNPPFGTDALKSAPDLAGLTGMIEREFGIWRRDGRESLNLARFPIEVLFVERFLRLARPGGCVAIIVPDGILANARLAHVREWISRRAEVRAVISLPRHTFHRTGAAAKASILLLRKNHGGKEDSEQTQKAPVLMGELQQSAVPKRHQGIEGSREKRSEVADDRFSQLSTLNPKPSTLPSLITHHSSLPAPGARLDPAYYAPEFVENARFLEGLPNTVPLGEFVEYMTYGQVGAREYVESGVRFLTPANLSMHDGYITRVDVHNPERFVPEGSWNDPARSRLRPGDLLLANSGVGCIGRAAVFYGTEPCNISQHINLVRLKGIEPEYLAVYLQTRFGRLQIHREKCGVGASGINFGRIRSILVPVLPGEIRQRIAEDYRRVQQTPSSMAALVAELEGLIIGRRG